MSIKDIEGECTDDDDFFIEIATKICNCKNVCYHLKVPEQKLKSISKKCNDSEQNIAVLWAWKRTLGSKATYFVLVRAFLDMSCPSIAECIMEYAKFSLEASQRKPSQITPAKCFPDWDKLSDSDKRKVINQDYIPKNIDFFWVQCLQANLHFPIEHILLGNLKKKTWKMYGLLYKHVLV